MWFSLFLLPVVSLFFLSLFFLSLGYEVMERSSGSCKKLRISCLSAQNCEWIGLKEGKGTPITFLFLSVLHSLSNFSSPSIPFAYFRFSPLPFFFFCNFSSFLFCCYIQSLLICLFLFPAHSLLAFPLSFLYFPSLFFLFSSLSLSYFFTAILFPFP